MTGMYNVIERLRGGEVLTAVERKVHDLAAVSVLRDLHDELDRLVAEGYDWAWPMEQEEILDRLVARHDQRVVEERSGVIRWLRPNYQVPRFGKDTAPAIEDLDLSDTAAVSAEREPWPASAADQIQALQNVVMHTPCTIDDATARLMGTTSGQRRPDLSLQTWGEAKHGPIHQNLYKSG